MKNLLGIYEKALPDSFSWRQKLQSASDLGFDFVEISIDETDQRLERLYWTTKQRADLRSIVCETAIPLMSMCFSGQRRFPMGSRKADVRAKSMNLMERAIDFASEIGIRVIQLAGYDVYYEESGPDTQRMFLENLIKAVEMASRRQVMLALEIMDTNYLDSISKYLWFDEQVNSPWLNVYPDLGNLTAWGHDLPGELKKGIHRTVGIHIKDTLAVTKDFPGRFKEVPFGTGCVDFVTAFKALREVHYAGPFMIEMWTGQSVEAIAEVDAAKAFITEKMIEAGYAFA